MDPSVLPFSSCVQILLFPSLLCSVPEGLTSADCMAWAPLASGFLRSRADGRCQQQIREWRGDRVSDHYLLFTPGPLLQWWLRSPSYSHSPCQATVQGLGQFSLPLPLETRILYSVASPRCLSISFGSPNPVRSPFINTSSVKPFENIICFPLTNIPCIHAFTHPSIHPSVHPSIHLQIYPPSDPRAWSTYYVHGNMVRALSSYLIKV